MAFVLKKMAKPGDPLDPNHANIPLAPGANRSPQVPGEVPDRSSVPGEGELPLTKASVIPRPAVERGTASGLLGLNKAVDNAEMKPEDFELSNASYEEVRKANPALRTPVRPAAGYALADGTRLASAHLAALSENISTADPD